MKNIFVEGIQGTGYQIRHIESTEYKVLDDFLYEAIFIPEGVAAPPREIINDPQLQVYVQDFGVQEGDICYVAETEGKIIGAVRVDQADILLGIGELQNPF